MNDNILNIDKFNKQLHYNLGIALKIEKLILKKKNSYYSNVKRTKKLNQIGLPSTEGMGIGFLRIKH